MPCRIAIPRTPGFAEGHSDRVVTSVGAKMGLTGHQVKQPGGAFRMKKLKSRPRHFVID